MITVKQFIKDLEQSLIPYALENSEGSYDLALEKTREAFMSLPLSDNQIRSLVNKVWDRVNKTQEVM